MVALTRSATNTFSYALVLDMLQAQYARFKAARAQRKVFNKTCDELSSLTNAELADIGIARSQITSVAYEHAYGAPNA